MERESFESDSIAALLNKDFVSIKVDKEERPDVDRVYVCPFCHTIFSIETASSAWSSSECLLPCVCYAC